MNMLVWAPPKTNPSLTAVLVPDSVLELSHRDYLDRLEFRLQDLMDSLAEEQGPEAVQDLVEAVLPEDHDFLDNPTSQWAEGVMEAAGLVQARLSETLSGQAWPQKVVNQPEAAKALQDTSLETWLALAVPQEQTS